VLIFMHLAAFRRTGPVGPWDQSKARTSTLFWPDQLIKDTIAVTFVILLLVALAAFSPPPITGPADPTDTSFIPKPEWNFLFLYQALKFFPGRLETLGTIGVPLLAILLLVSVPWLDRKDERNPWRRPVAVASFGVAAIVLVGLTLAGYLSKPDLAVSSSVVLPAAKAAPVQAPAGAVATPGDPGASVFAQSCVICHGPQGAGKVANPGSSEGVVPPLNPIDPKLKDPNPQAFLAKIDPIIQKGDTPGGPSPTLKMPAFQNTLTIAQIASVEQFILQLNGVLVPAASTAVGTATPVATASPTSAPPMTSGPAASVIGSAGHGSVLFERQCASCHGAGGAGAPASSGGPPALSPIRRQLKSDNPQAFVDNIDPIIQHGAISGGTGLQMPAFGDSNSLTQAQIADLEAYILRINGVDRAMLKNPGVQPVFFFWMVLVVLLVPGLVALGAWRITQGADKNK
jgi:menaquinol-cytochrome c reductase cytochrome b/c subunit